MNICNCCPFDCCQSTKTITFPIEAHVHANNAPQSMERGMDRGEPLPSASIISAVSASAIQFSPSETYSASTLPHTVLVDPKNKKDLTHLVSETFTNASAAGASSYPAPARPLQANSNSLSIQGPLGAQTVASNASGAAAASSYPAPARPLQPHRPNSVPKAPMAAQTAAGSHSNFISPSAVNEKKYSPWGQDEIAKLRLAEKDLIGKAREMENKKALEKTPSQAKTPSNNQIISKKMKDELRMAIQEGLK